MALGAARSCLRCLLLTAGHGWGLGLYIYICATCLAHSVSMRMHSALMAACHLGFVHARAEGTCLPKAGAKESDHVGCRAHSSCSASTLFQPLPGCIAQEASPTLRGTRTWQGTLDCTPVMVGWPSAPGQPYAVHCMTSTVPGPARRPTQVIVHPTHVHERAQASRPPHNALLVYIE